MKYDTFNNKYLLNFLYIYLKVLYIHISNNIIENLIYNWKTVIININHFIILLINLSIQIQRYIIIKNIDQSIFIVSIIFLKTIWINKSFYILNK